jgi:hypothetical protein
MPIGEGRAVYWKIPPPPPTGGNSQCLLGKIIKGEGKKNYNVKEKMKGEKMKRKWLRKG